MDVGLLSKIGFDFEVAIANLVNFLIIFLIFRIFFFKPIQKMIDTRKARITEGLEQAAQAERMLKEANQNAEALIRDAKKNADELLQDARQYVTNLKEQAQLESQAERAQMLARVEQEILQERRKMVEDVEEEMTTLVAQLSEKVLGSTVDAGTVARVVAEKK